MRQRVDSSDTEIVDRVLAGDQTQYQILVERHYRVVFNAAYRLLGNQAEAADTTQEAFLRAYQALDTFQRGAPMSPWLSRIAVNLAINLLKGRRPTLSLDDDSCGTPLDLPDLSTEPQRNLLRAEQQRELRRAILALSPQQRAVIELRHFQEQSYQEIAASMNISLANVKVRLFRARKKLRQILQQEA